MTGSFHEFPKDMKPGEFKDAMFDLLKRDWHETYLLWAPTTDKEVQKMLERSGLEGQNAPVGLVAMRVRDNRGSRLTFEPHVVWFDWATTRNKVETTVKFLNHQRVDRFLLIFADKDSRSFFEKSIKRYGIIRTVGGSISKYPPFNDGPAWIFESKGIDE